MFAVSIEPVTKRAVIIPASCNWDSLILPVDVSTGLGAWLLRSKNRSVRWRGTSPGQTDNGTVFYTHYRWKWPATKNTPGSADENFGPLLHAKFHPRRCNVSPLRGEKPQNRPLSKLNTGRLALRAMLPVKITFSNPTCPWCPH